MDKTIELLLQSWLEPHFLDIEIFIKKIVYFNFFRHREINLVVFLVFTAKWAQRLTGFKTIVFQNPLKICFCISVRKNLIGRRYVGYESYGQPGAISQCSESR